ncbi:hypothetical protein DFH27DRAFT_524372 [Peziza echinospora]|nr:hypothetical protein DFH27DRAFT_524372 [Peziza echinospora]
MADLGVPDSPTYTGLCFASRMAKEFDAYEAMRGVVGRKWDETFFSAVAEKGTVRHAELEQLRTQRLEDLEDLAGKLREHIEGMLTQPRLARLKEWAQEMDEEVSLAKEEMQRRMEVIRAELAAAAAGMITHTEATQPMNEEKWAWAQCTWRELYLAEWKVLEKKVAWAQKLQETLGQVKVARLEEWTYENWHQSRPMWVLLRQAEAKRGVWGVRMGWIRQARSALAARVMGTQPVQA